MTDADLWACFSVRLPVLERVGAWRKRSSGTGILEYDVKMWVKCAESGIFKKQM